MSINTLSEFDTLSQNEENNGGVSLYAVQDTLRDNIKWRGYDYREKLLANSVSPYLLRNLKVSNFLKYLNDICVEYIETVKKVRIYYNFTVDKDTRYIN